MRTIVLLAILAGSFYAAVADDIQLKVSRGQVALDQANLASTGNFSLGPGLGIRQTFTASAAGRIAGIEIAPLLGTLAPSDPVILDVAAPGGGYRTVTMTAAGFPPGGGSIPAPLDLNLKGPGYFDVSGLGIDVGVGQVVEFVLRNGTAPGVCGTAHVCTAGRIGDSCVSNSQCDKSLRAGFNESQYAGGAGTHPSNPTLNFDLAFKTLLRTGMQESVTLDWTGGAPSFQVYRSSSAVQVIHATHHLGGTAARDWGDTPPAGTIFFYAVTSCVVTPEICDGLDNDCDGVVDGPGSESSCTAPGECYAATCDPSGSCSYPVKPDNSPCGGGACCNGTCTAINMAQSNSPTNLYPESVKQGYAAVAAITNCGACGQDCGGPSACVTKLCVPQANGIGFCGQYSRYQCAGARCAGSEAGSLPGLVEPSCASPNNDDGDGLVREWETPQPDPYSSTPTTQPTAGVDLNCDGEISDAGGDLIFHEPPAGDQRKDVYLELDVMGNAAGTGYINDPILGVFPEGPNPHEPPTHPSTGQTAVSAVVQAFARADITLHVDPVRNTLPHTQVMYLSGDPSNQACIDVIDPISGELSVAMQSFKPAYFDPRRRLGYHYVVVGHDSCMGPGAGESSPFAQGTGGAEIGGNDVMVSLGSRTYYKQQFCSDSNGDGASDSLSCCEPTDCCIGREANWHVDCGVLIPIRSNSYSCEGAPPYEVCVTSSYKVQRFWEWTGTFLHQLGHSLGLCHDGLAQVGSLEPCSGAVVHQPNHISSMNPLYQLLGIFHQRHDRVNPVTGLPEIDTTPSIRVDFSRGLDGFSEDGREELDEMALDETVGISILQWPYMWDGVRYFNGPALLHTVPGVGGSIDWNDDGVLDTSIALDINNDSLLSFIPPSANEWGGLFFGFACSTNVDN